jgi:hypothetical protein
MKLAATALAFLALSPAPADTIAFGPTGHDAREELRDHDEAREALDDDEGRRARRAGRDAGRLVMDMDFKKTIVVQDEYKKMDGARTLALERNYTTLTDHDERKIQMPGMPEPKEDKEDKESDLLDKTVLFSWNADEDRYDKKWVGEGGSEKRLEGLEEDMDLRCLMPKKAVSADDTWKVDLVEFGEVLGPGGDLGFSAKDKDEDDNQFEKNLSGEAVCTYAGTKDVEGRKLAVIQITCKARTFQEKEEGEREMRVDFSMDLKGEALWDVGAKHLATYALSGDITAEMKITQAMEVQGQSHDLVVNVDLGGKYDIEGKFGKP